MLSITPIPAFTDNYIWCLADTTTGHALIVDPGQAEPVHKHLEAQGLTLDTILITHHHPDHTGGVQDLARALKPSRVVGPDGSPYPHISHPVRAGDEVVWEDITFTVHSIPGHTLDHIAFHSDTPVDGHGILFCGDTLFACGCGRIFEGTPEQMHRSLATLRQLPDTTAVYCGHEYTLANLRFARSWLPQDPELARYEQECQARRKRGEPTLPSTMALERQLNPFLRWDDPVLAEAARDYAAQQGLPADSETAIFAAVRHGKDHF